MSQAASGPVRDPAAPWAGAGASGPHAAALRALDEARSGRIVLQDYVPLADSLEWRLGQEYLRKRGGAAFVADEQPVPFVVNNDGNLSIRAAEVFFTSLVMAERNGGLPEDLFVLELGIGVGLFARYFLDWFNLICEREGKDYYDRLTYIAADRSARMLRDAGRAGVFANHAGHYRLRLADALSPAEGITVDHDVRRLGPRPLRAVFLNYLLDCLPACVVRVENGQPQLLHSRSGLPAGADWRSLLDVDADELKRLAAMPAADRSAELLAVYPLVQAEYQFRDVEPGSLEYEEFILAQAAEAPGRAVLHSHGALRCLEGLLDLLADGGLILANDYGQTKEVFAEEFEHQRFSQATFVGVNFALLGRYFAKDERACWREPSGDEEQSVHARLVMRKAESDVIIRFTECYGEPARLWLEGPAKRARELAQAGRRQAAISQYREALSRQPFSWPLLSEVSHFLTFYLGDARGGLELARQALAHNPASSADLWNLLGDCLFELGRLTEARRAFEKALVISPDDVRARFNLAFVHVRWGEYERALVRLAEGLARDRTGVYRERLLGKQNEVLALLQQSNQRRLLGQVDRVAGIGPLAGVLPAAQPRSETPR